MAVIWFFLMGMIAGAVGMVMYSHHWMQKHTRIVRVKHPVEEDSQDDEQDELH